MLEYEDALLRQIGSSNLTPADVQDLVDYVCGVARQQDIFYLWRPLLRDPNDDMVAEVAVAAGCEAIVTHNRRDFAGVERFNLSIWSPAEFLKQIGVRK